MLSPAATRSLTLEHALLGFLHRRPMHAYELHRTLAHSAELGLVWRLKQARLYALLRRLEAAGYISAVAQEQDAGPPRTLLGLTPQGRVAFERWVGSPVRRGRDLRLEFLAKLYFARELGPPQVARLVARQRRECEAWAEELSASATAADRPYTRLVCQFRLGQVHANLRWLELCDTSQDETGRSETGP